MNPRVVMARVLRCLNGALHVTRTAMPPAPYFLRYSPLAVALFALASAVGLLAAAPAKAHEFWMLPSVFAPPARTPLALSLHVGEQFEGDPVAFAPSVVSSFTLINAQGTQDLTTQVHQQVQHPLSVSPLPRVPEGNLPLAFEQRGAVLLAMDSHTNTIELAPDRFTAYLRDEGLEHVIAQREQQGHSARPGRERYRRHIKTLLHVGGPLAGKAATTDTAVHAQRTGQRLEIVPLSAPQLLKAPTGFEVLFANAPLSGALVKAWHRSAHGGALRGTPSDIHPLTVLRARSDATGRVTLRLPWCGVWMLSVVHMVPAGDQPDIDWDSHWGNLTFERPCQRTLRRGG